MLELTSLVQAKYEDFFSKFNQVKALYHSSCTSNFPLILNSIFFTIGKIKVFFTGFLYQKYFFAISFKKVHPFETSLFSFTINMSFLFPVVDIDAPVGLSILES